MRWDYVNYFSFFIAQIIQGIYFIGTCSSPTWKFLKLILNIITNIPVHTKSTEEEFKIRSLYEWFSYYLFITFTDSKSQPLLALYEEIHVAAAPYKVQVWRAIFSNMRPISIDCVCDTASQVNGINNTSYVLTLSTFMNSNLLKL